MLSVLAEASAYTGAADAEAILLEAETLMERRKMFLVRPQLLRARGILLERQGDLARAAKVLLGSAESARGPRLT